MEEEEKEDVILPAIFELQHIDSERHLNERSTQGRTSNLSKKNPKLKQIWKRIRRRPRATSAFPSEPSTLQGVNTLLLPDINRRAGFESSLHRPISTFETSTAIPLGLNKETLRRHAFNPSRRESFTSETKGRRYIRWSNAIAKRKKTESGSTISSKPRSRGHSRGSSRDSRRSKKSNNSTSPPPMAEEKSDTTIKNVVCAPKAGEKPDATKQKEKCGSMVRLGTIPVYRDRTVRYSEDVKSEFVQTEMSYYERIQKGGRSGRSRGRSSKAPPMVCGWDVARPLGPHTLDHLPDFSEIAQQMNDYVNKFMRKSEPSKYVPQKNDYVDKFAHGVSMPKPESSENEPEPSENEPEPSENESDPNFKVPQYLARHGIQDLFRLMTSSLIVKRPEDPLEYLIGFTAMLGTHIRNANYSSASTRCYCPPTSPTSSPPKSSPRSSPTSSPTSSPKSSSHGQQSGQGQDGILSITSPIPLATGYVRFCY